MIRLMLLSVFLSSLGQIAVKTGADRLKGLTLSPDTLFFDVMRVLRVPEFWLAMTMFAISSLIWVKVLTRSELTHAYPFNSMGYVFVLILSSVLLGEGLTLQKIGGTAIIICGIMILQR